MNYITDELFKNKDLKYKEFNDKIINTSYKTIGVRMNVLKSIVKKVIKEKNEILIDNLENNYFEHVMLKGLAIASIADTNTCLNKLDSFLDLIDSWAICDTVSSACKCFKKDLSNVLSFVDKNIKSNNCYRVRFSFVTLLNYFINEKYLSLIFNYCDNDNSTQYYVMMAKAWLISTCYIKYPKQTLTYLNISKIDSITYNKAISKICDSYKVSKEDKCALKNMKKKLKKA